MKIVDESGGEMLSISSGHSAGYLTGAVAVGRENYYLDAATEGEPPGRWYGAGAEALGLAGEVDHQDMEALYSHFVDPTDPNFRNPEQWAEAKRLGAAPGRYKTADEHFATLLEREPGATDERREELRLQAASLERSPVQFLDLTFSPAKSVTAVHTAAWRRELRARREGNFGEAEKWANVRVQVEEAHHEAVNAALNFMQDRAGYSRAGHHGGAGGRWIDGHGWIVGVFFQHTNRNDEPQVHSHCAVLNRVQSDDGKWRALDSRTIHTWRPAGGAVYERHLHAGIAQRLGLASVSRADGNGLELAGVSEQMIEALSSRRRAITAKVGQLVGAFRAKFGREPNALELTGLSQQATMATRKAKNHHAPTAEQRAEAAHQAAREAADGGLDAVAAVVDPDQPRSPVTTEPMSPTAVISAAMARVQATQATWTEPDLIRAVSDALPANLGIDPAQTTDLLTRLAREALTVPDDIDGAGGTPAGTVSAHGAVAVTAAVPATLPDELKLANGSSALAAPGSARYTTTNHVAGERMLERAAVERGRLAVAEAQADRWLSELPARGLTLGADQEAAVRGVLTSGAAVEVLIGPAGTGKSTTAGALAAGWSELTGGRVVGLATAQGAAEVLAGEGLHAANITRWLDAQRALAAGTERPDQRQHRITARDIVLVDESGMADTAALAEVRERCAAAGAKLLLTGDHRQLAAVGAGGMLSALTGRALTYQLGEVHRFAESWEADASLRLRDRDRDAISEYDRRGRIRDCGTAAEAERQAVTGWLADTLAGRRSIIVCSSNEQAQRVSAAARAELVRLGKVGDEEDVPLGLDGNRAGVGDLVQARLNGWQLDRYAGNAQAPINRRVYRVEQALDDGGLVVSRLDDPTTRLTLPGTYVHEHVSLGYASTAHSAQGQTVDTAHTLVDGGTDARGLYVGMSRGRTSNTAYVTTLSEPVDGQPGEAHDTPRVEAAGVVARILEGAQDEQAATVEVAESTQAARSALTLVERMAAVVEPLTQARVTSTLDRLTNEGALTEEQRAALTVDEATPQLAQLLRRAELAGHDFEQTLTDAVTGRSLEGSRSLAQVIHARIGKRLREVPTATTETFAERVPPIADAQLRGYVSELADLADDRRRELGTLAAQEQPEWAVSTLGPVPDDAVARLEWEDRAGRIAVDREVKGVTDESVAVGPAPKGGLTEHVAVHRAAWAAAGYPEAGREEAEMSDGQLRVRLSAWEREQAHEPAYIPLEDMRAAAEEADQQRQQAILDTMAADAPGTTPERAAELRERAQLAELHAEQAAARRDQLEAQHQVRAQHQAHTAVTRENARRAEAELTDRGIPVGNEPDRTTAAEWLAGEVQARREDDHHRQVHEDDLTDEHRQPAERDVTALADDDLADEPEEKDPQQRAVEAVERLADELSEEAAHQASERARQAENDHMAAVEMARRQRLRAEAEQAYEEADADV